MRKAIATLLSLCVMFSIMAQGLIAYAEEPNSTALTAVEQQPDQEPEVQEATALEEQEAGE